MPGFTCAVPGCYNNTAKHKQVKFHRFPQDKKLQKLWISKIKRPGPKGKKFSLFEPTIGHRICSAHFEGGKKTIKNNVPTIFPLIKNKTPSVRKTRTSLHGIAGLNKQTETESKVAEEDVTVQHEVIECIPDLIHERLREVNDHPYAVRCEETDFATLGQMLKEKMKNITEIENKFSEMLEEKDKVISNLRTVISRIQESNRGVVSDMENEMKNLEEELTASKQQISQLKYELRVGKIQNARMMSQNRYIKATAKSELRDVKMKLLDVESVRCCEEKLKLYTGFSHFDQFQALFDYIKEDVEATFSAANKNKKFSRKLSPENSLLLVLAHLRLGLLEKDLAHRFGVSQSTISRVLTTYLEILQRRQAAAYCKLLFGQVFARKFVTTKKNSHSLLEACDET